MTPSNAPSGRNEVMVVTGGSRGIGAATARLGAARGYRVCLSYVNDKAAADRVVVDVTDAGGDAVAVRADVSEPADVAALFEAASAVGRVAVVVNNAGILFRQGRVEDTDANRLRRLLDVNVVGAFLVARSAVHAMSSAFGGSGGSLVNVSSRAAILGAAHEYVDYAASKAAVDALTIGLSQEAAPFGVRVNAVRPGIIRTDIHASGGEPGRTDRLAPTIPLRRAGEPDEVARAILWLASDEASYVTGTFIDVGGGR